MRYSRDYFGVGGAGRSADAAEVGRLCVHGLGTGDSMRLLAAHAEAEHPRLARLVEALSYCEVASPHPPPGLGLGMPLRRTRWAVPPGAGQGS